MIGGLCIVLPLALAALVPWVRGVRALSLGCAVLYLALAVSMPWTGSSLGGWLLPDPLVVHVMVLTGFAWLMANGLEASPAPLALLVGLVSLALLSDGAGLTAIAAGGAGVAAVFCLRLAAPGPLLAAAATGAGLAVFGTVLLYVGTAPAIGPGWSALRWSALSDLGAGANGMALSAGYGLMMLGLGVSCGLTPIWAMWSGAILPRGLAMLAGPLGGVWLVVALRLRGVLDGSGHAIAPGGLLLTVGLAGLGTALLCLRERGGTVAACLIAVFGAVLVGFGTGGAAATDAALLHLTLGCLALSAAATGSRVGLAALAGLPPLGVFASGFALVMDAAGWSAVLATILGCSLFGVAALALRRLPPTGQDARLGWIGVGLALVGAWTMPPAIAAWLQGIAAAAR